MSGQEYFAELDDNSSFKDVLDAIYQIFMDDDPKNNDKNNRYKYWMCFQYAYKENGEGGESKVVIDLNEEQINSIIDLYNNENKKLLEHYVKMLQNDRNKKKRLSELLFYYIFDGTIGDENKDYDKFRLNNDKMIKLINIISDKDKNKLIETLKKYGIQY
jgi:hypothetical protein